MAQQDVCIAVLDDDQSVLRSMERLFRLHGFAARTFLSADSLLDALDDLRPSCIVADVAMPGIDGLQFQQQLEAAGAPFPIVFVTARDDVRCSVEAMRHGAVDFLAKPFVEDELFDAIDRAIEQARASRERETNGSHYRKRLDSLTPRERQVFGFVVNGLMNKQIAAQLAIAEKTVKIHRARIMRKMGVRSIAQLARLAERFGDTAAAG